MTSFKPTSDLDLLKATLFNRSRLSESGCWIWVGSRGPNGYGMMSRNSKTVRVHRVSCEAYHGPIPDGMSVLHSCDNPSCINPDHLRVGTHQENVAEREERNRRDVKGEQIGTSKLTSREVLEIKASVLSGVELARKYEVSTSTISLIRTGRSWVHLDNGGQPCP
jgi:hypothetical protein